MKIEELLNVKQIDPKDPSQFMLERCQAESGITEMFTKASYIPMIVNKKTGNVLLIGKNSMYLTSKDEVDEFMKKSTLYYFNSDDKFFLSENYTPRFRGAAPDIITASGFGNLMYYLYDTLGMCETDFYRQQCLPVQNLYKSVYLDKTRNTLFLNEFFPLPDKYDTVIGTIMASTTQPYAWRLCKDLREYCFSTFSESYKETYSYGFLFDTATFNVKKNLDKIEFTVKNEIVNHRSYRDNTIIDISSGIISTLEYITNNAFNPSKDYFLTEFTDFIDRYKICNPKNYKKLNDLREENANRKNTDTLFAFTLGYQNRNSIICSNCILPDLTKISLIDSKDYINIFEKCITTFAKCRDHLSEFHVCGGTQYINFAALIGLKDCIRISVEKKETYANNGINLIFKYQQRQFCMRIEDEAVSTQIFDALVKCGLLTDEEATELHCKAILSK